ncbi:MAG TPA: hypothetical protein VMV39_04275 [Terracidiphilus sp.]|nr:hypothetical protein [Terracidiphilus sp.]
MKPLDDQLRNLLRRREPPEGFAERLLARLEAAPPRLTFAQRLSALYRRPVLRWAAVTALVCVMTVLGVVRYQNQQRLNAQAEQASREAILALRITSTELQTALERAQHATMQALTDSKNSKQETE